MSYPLNNKGKIWGGREGDIVIFTRLNFYNEPKIDLCFANNVMRLCKNFGGQVRPRELSCAWSRDQASDEQAFSLKTSRPSEAPINIGAKEGTTRAMRKTFCALGGIRTPNNCFEGRDDIHFTTRAFFIFIFKISIFAR